MAAPVCKKLKTPAEKLQDEVGVRIVEFADGEQMQRWALLERYVAYVRKMNEDELICDCCGLVSFSSRVGLCRHCHGNVVCVEEYCETFAFQTPHGYYCSERCMKAELCAIQNCKQCICGDCDFVCCDLCERNVCIDHSKETDTDKCVCVECIDELIKK